MFPSSNVHPLSSRSHKSKLNNGSKNSANGSRFTLTSISWRKKSWKWNLFITWIWDQNESTRSTVCKTGARLEQREEVEMMYIISHETYCKFILIAYNVYALLCALCCKSKPYFVEAKSGEHEKCEVFSRISRKCLHEVARWFWRLKVLQLKTAEC